MLEGGLGTLITYNPVTVSHDATLEEVKDLCEQNRHGCRDDIVHANKQRQRLLAKQEQDNKRLQEDHDDNDNDVDDDKQRPRKRHCHSPGQERQNGRQEIDESDF